MSMIVFSFMSRNARNGENSESAKNCQMDTGYQRRSFQSGEVDKNGESGKHWSQVWQIFKLDDKSGLFQSGGFDENGEYDEKVTPTSNGENGEKSQVLLAKKKS